MQNIIATDISVAQAKPFIAKEAISMTTSFCAKTSLTYRFLSTIAVCIASLWRFAHRVKQAIR